jgi:site-specific DNA recombinase
MVSRLAVWGYDFDETTGGYKINEENANIVQMMYRRFLEIDGGCQKFAHMLNSEGYRSPTGKLWGYTAVHRTLTCETYTGTFYGLKKYHKKVSQDKRKDIARDKSEWIPVDVPVIIERGLFDAVQKKIQQNKQRSERKTKGEYLLRGIAYCTCGRKMLVYNCGVNSGGYIRYGCGSKRDTITKKNCGSRMIRCDMADKKVWEAFVDCFMYEENIDKVMSQGKTSDNSEEIQKLKTEEEKLVKQRKHIVSLITKQLITENEADNGLQNIKNRIDEINQRLSTLTTCTHRTPKEINELFLSRYEKNLPFDERRRLLMDIVREVIIYRSDNNYGIHGMTIESEFIVK